MNLKEWAAGQGVSYATALRWFKAGKLPVPAYRAGRLIVIGSPAPAPSAGATVVYARVSSADQRPDLVRDVSEILTSLCARRYGRRVAASRAARAVKALGQDDPS